jgi:hypothetical protein
MLIRVPVLIGHDDESTNEVLVETRHIVYIDRDSEFPEAHKIHLVGGDTLPTPLSLDTLESLTSGGSAYHIELTPEEALSLSR